MGIDEREFFRYLNKIVILCWRLRLGWLFNTWPSVLGRMALLVVTGRKTGLTRYAPVNYAPGTGEVYCVAGYGEKTHWYRNTIAKPEIEIWLPQGRRRARAETIIEPALRLATIRTVLQNSGFAAKTFAGIDPFSISDEQLALETEEYMALRIVL
jgi:deazaflavin-dependent oxidoreductase (nitroreductase family)